MKNGQSNRILEYMKAKPNQDIPAVELHRIGSGKENGFCASLSRRISDLRQAGYLVEKTKDEIVNGQRHTWYQLKQRSR